jgi:pSer/pThr/pTyr-binding forkhead associated (FHA) protein
MTALTRGGLVIGRATSCDVMLDDAAVSRRHARVALVEEEPVLQDLGSANGVFVNGRRVDGTQRLAEGDVIVIGPRVFRLQTTESVVSSKKKKRVSTIDQLWDSAKLESPGNTATEISDALVLADRGAAELLREGRAAEAEQLLEPQLVVVLERARSGNLPSGAGNAGRLALELARRSRKQRWLEYVLDLYEAAASVPPPALSVELPKTMQVLGLKSLPRLDAYLANMQARSAELDDEMRGRLTDFVALCASELRRSND